LRWRETKAGSLVVAVSTYYFDIYGFVYECNRGLLLVFLGIIARPVIDGTIAAARS
jgi:hypothetical protein